MLKVIIQNPQLTSDTFTSGINDYVVEYLRKVKPAIRIWPLYRFKRWLIFLIKKGLPLTGWKYIFSDDELNKYDVWMSFEGCPVLPTDSIPKNFKGLKIFHLMDYSFWSKYCAKELIENKVDFLFGYAKHDLWCSYFKSVFGEFKDRVIPLPFGYSKRFSNLKTINDRNNKCSVMGAVNPIIDPMSDLESIKDYIKFFHNEKWAHKTRAHVRDNLYEFENLLVSFMANPPLTKNIKYDSVKELKEYKFFLNDDSVMHYPPARTYEGTASGAVMVCSDHPCYNDFNWKSDKNCITYREGDYDDLKNKLRLAVTGKLDFELIQKYSLKNALRFSHEKLSDSLNNMLFLLINGKDKEVLNYWINE